MAKRGPPSPVQENALTNLFGDIAQQPPGHEAPAAAPDVTPQRPPAAQRQRVTEHTMQTPERPALGSPVPAPGDPPDELRAFVVRAVREVGERMDRCDRELAGHAGDITMVQDALGQQLNLIHAKAEKQDSF